MKTWNIGNTTVRNPRRIRDGLQVLQKHFEGTAWDEAGQAFFYEKLVELGIIEAYRDKLPPLKSRGISGRKWAAAPNQLGFCRAWTKKRGLVLITPAGKSLISAKNEKNHEEIFLRQLLKYQLPSTIELGSDYRGFEIMPFRFMLKIMHELHKRSVEGITKEEMALFVITKIKNELALSAVEEIISYRNKRDKLKGLVVKRKFFNETRFDVVKNIYSEEFKADHAKLRKIFSLRKKASSSTLATHLKEISAGGKGSETKNAQNFVRDALQLLRRGCTAEELINLFDEMRLAIRGNTLLDYADSAARYASLTGLFSNNGKKLVLANEIIKLIDQIVGEGFPMIDNDKFEAAFYAADKPSLPTDDMVFLSSYVKELEIKKEKLHQSIKIEPTVRAKAPIKDTLLDMKEYRLGLEAEITEYREYEFYKKQSEVSSIKDIHSFFEGIRERTLMGGQAYLPAFLEWTIWRVFLAINTIEGNISRTRNFLIDEELNPIHHAKGGVADMVFTYADFVMPCEVTLNNGENQWSAEGEPVPRHIAKIVGEVDKEAIGIFIAPNIHPQSAQQFLMQTYHIGGKFVPLNIIPFNIAQIETLLKVFEERRFSVTELKSLLKSCVKLKEGSPDGVEWLEKLNAYFISWTRK